MTLFCYMILCPIMPRFIIGMRELYDFDVRGRRQRIDTGFGVSSRSVFTENAAMSAIEFADRVAPGRGQGQVAEGEVGGSVAIRREMLGDGTRQV